MLSQKLMVPVD